MNNRIKLSIIIASILLLGIGCYIGEKLGKELNDYKDNENITNRTSEYEIRLYEQQTLNSFQNTGDINVTFIDFYTLCGEEIRKSETYYNTTIDEVKNIVANDYKDYVLCSEENNNLTFKKEIDENCKHHYMVKIVRDEIEIFRVINDDKQEIIKTLDTPINILDEEFIAQLKKGININSEEELNSIIEDLES